MNSACSDIKAFAHASGVDSNGFESKVILNRQYAPNVAYWTYF